MYPHRIRLRGPWEAKFASSDGQSEEKRLNFPSTWAALPQDLNGPVRLVRNFGRPRELDENEHVWLTWSGVTATASLQFNSDLLGNAISHSGSVEVTSHIRERNELIVEFGSPGSPGAGFGDFALEVRGPVYIEGARFVPEGSSVEGAVRGELVKNLELYLLMFGLTVHRQLIELLPSGMAFSIPCPRPTAVPKTREFPPIRLELIEGSNLWWRVDLPVDFASPDSSIPAASAD